MGFDSRVARAMLKLGYRIFPFEAFDEAGNLRTSAQVNFPPDVDAGLGRIVSNPLWGDLYRTLSPLGQEGVFMAGIGFLNDRVQVALFRPTTSVPDASAALNWATAYHATVEATLHGYAGRTYLIDPALRKVIDKARGYLPPPGKDSGGTEDTGGADGEEGSALQTGEPDAPAAENPVLAASIPWLTFGLDLLAELLVNATVRTKVLTTVCWYPPSLAGLDFAKMWKPIHAANLQTGVLSGHRSAHLIWNPVGLPVTWRGSEVSWKGPGFDMPADPTQWCQALRPLANCLNSPMVAPAAVETVAAVEAVETVETVDNGEAGDGEEAAAELDALKQQLAAGFRSAGRAGLADAVDGADFSLWVRQESGWNPRAVSGRTNQGKVNGGLFQFWYGHSWAQPYFSRGNDPRSVFTMPPADQARAVVRHFPHVTAATVRTYAQQIRNGTYHGWG